MSPSPASWVLHSPCRFVVFLLAAFVVLTLASWLVARGTSSDVVRRSTESAVSTPGTAGREPIAEPSGAHEEQLLGPSAQRTLKKFLTRYLAPTTRTKMDRLRSLTTDTLWAGLSVADPTNMPVGPAKATTVESEGAYSATYVVRLPDASIRVDIVAEPSGPKVASVEPVQP